MQKVKHLNKESLEILERAKEHAKKTWREQKTSIAAVLKTKHKFYTGINIKYRNIWKCICAERMAIAKAIEKDDSAFNLLVSVKYSPEANSYEVVNMCGECLQIAINYSSLKVIVDDKGLLRVVYIKDLFPFPYV